MSFRGPEGNSRREPITTAVRVRSGVLRLVDSRWVLDTDSRATADGYLVIDADGRPAVDDAAASGQTVVAVGGRILTY